MQKRKLLKVSAVMFVFVTAFCLAVVIGNYGKLNTVNRVYADESMNRNGIYKASYTANGKTSTEWCYLKNGKVQYGFTGFASNSSGWWYVEKGRITFKKNDVISGTVKGQSGWWYVKGSQVKFVDSVEKNSAGWWFIQKGKVNFNYTGLAKRGSDWWYCKKGKVDFGFTGLCKYNGSWWYCKKGKVDFGFTGLCKYNGSWWYVKSGKVDFGYTGLCKYSGSWWYVKSGKLDFGYTGLCKYSGSWWYVKGGKVDFGYAGLCKYSGSWWYVKGGKVDMDYTSLCKYSGTWWFVKNGKVDFGFAGIVKYSGSWWYVNGGKAVLNYNGSVMLNKGGTVTVKNGQVTGNDGKGNITRMMSSAKYINIWTDNSITSLDGKFTVSMDDWKKIYLYSWDDDFFRVIDILTRTHPDLYNYIEYVNFGVAGSGDEYISGIDTALVGANEYPSIFAADISVAKYWLEDTYKTASLSSIGITDDMYANAYNFTKQYATYNGQLRAATWMGCPGVFTYRRDIAKQVFGVSEPADVQKLVKDWDSFFATAEKLKKAGKYIVSGPDDIKYAVWGGQTQPWITMTANGSEKLTLDSSVTNYLKYAKKLFDGGYTKRTSAWCMEWYDNMSSNDVFGYFGTTWFMGQIAGNCGNTFGKWGACTGPSPYVWGGTYVMVGKDTPNPDLCAFIIYEISCDSDFMYKITTDKGDFVNNRATNAKLIKNDYDLYDYSMKSVNDLLGGQNPIQAWADAAEKVDLSNATYLDYTIMGYIDFASSAYNWGEAATINDALAMIKKDAEVNLGLIVD